MRRYAWGLINLVLGLLIAAAAYMVIFERQALIDWWRLREYTPTAEVVQLADAGGFTPRAREAFYVSHPTVQSRELFNQNCQDESEESLVLGCYRALNIYIYNVTDPQLAGVKEVTAAHEMLHAAYDRLPSEEQLRVNNLLSQDMHRVGDERLKELIRLYNEREPGHLLNEMHSILGTEYRNLSPDLEAYYNKYFADRASVVAYAEKYETVFTQSKTRIAAYDSQLASLKNRIDDLTAKLNQQKEALDRQNAQMEQLQSTDVNAYNAQVPSYNAKVNIFNGLATEARALIEEYNRLVVARNAEAAAQDNLYRSLDSNSVPVAQ